MQNFFLIIRIKISDICNDYSGKKNKNKNLQASADGSCNWVRYFASFRHIAFSISNILSSIFSTLLHLSLYKHIKQCHDIISINIVANKLWT